jgi:hypothetical protein
MLRDASGAKRAALTLLVQYLRLATALLTALVGQSNASKCHNLDQYNIAHQDDVVAEGVQSNQCTTKCAQDSGQIPAKHLPKIN